MPDKREEMDWLEKLVLINGKAKRVKWGAIRKKFFKKMGAYWVPNRMWLSGGMEEKVWEILLNAGLLSIEKDGNYLILGSSVILGPHIHVTQLFFTHLSDAKYYIELIHDGVQYEIEIIKCMVEKKRN